MNQTIHPNGAPNIQFSGANSTFKPSKEDIERNKRRKTLEQQLEDIKHEKQFAEVWEEL